MRKLLLILIGTLFLGNSIFAQAPNKMSYQAVIRNSNNVVVSNHAVGMRISILQGTATGTSVYTETQTPTTNANGLIAIEIGSGTLVNGSFANIDWANGPYFVKTETDPNGGTNYTLTGTSQLLSVPYALHAKTAEKAKTTDTSNVAKVALNGFPSGGQNGQVLTMCDGMPIWTNNGQCPWPTGTVFCNGSPTAIVDVTNPITGKTWMDRNLGASQAATSSTDAAAYGDLYQWGRAADGHQCRNSINISTLSSSDQTGHSSFILAPNSPHDWRSPQNDNLWQGANGGNNPCPAGYRIPTVIELQSELFSWTQNNASGAYASALKFSLAGFHYNIGGSLFEVGTTGMYWSNSVSGTAASNMSIGSSSNTSIGINSRAAGFSVRCIKDYQPAIGSIDTVGTINNGVLYAGTAAINTSTTLNYTNGNGTTYEAQTVSSTGIIGLTATLVAGTLNNGNGSLTYNISGTPTSNGTASFSITIGGKTFVFQRVVLASNPTNTYPSGTVFCNGTPTAIVDVTNPITGKTWMDRNLGASQAATSSTDAAAYGDLYQWGRVADGHQCRNSGTTSTLSSSDQPNHSNFILAPNSPYDWRSTQNNNLWQGVNGINNPCPSSYRLPTNNELENERLSWSQNNSIGAFNSPLKIPMSGYRDNTNPIWDIGTGGYYWTSSVNATYSSFIYFYVGGTFSPSYFRARGMSVRCIKD